MKKFKIIIISIFLFTNICSASDLFADIDKEVELEQKILEQQYKSKEREQLLNDYRYGIMMLNQAEMMSQMEQQQCIQQEMLEQQRRMYQQQYMFQQQQMLQNQMQYNELMNILY